MHGGKTLQGIAQPRTTHGRYSKYLPARMAERYHEALADGELIAMREEIALLDSRLAELLKRVDTGEAGAVWRRAQAAFRALNTAIRVKDAAAMETALGELDESIGRGSADHAAWSEIHTLIDQRRRLAESEQKRLTAMEQLITTEQAQLLVSALLDSIRRNVTDRSALTAIQADFIRLFSVENRARVSAGATDK